MTLDTHGRSGAGSGGVTVNIGSLVLDGKLAVVTAVTRWPDEPQPEKAAVMSRAHHLDPVHDPDTAYIQPTALEFRWAGSPLLNVDVLAGIPYVIKTMVNYVAGMKPYIYQWQDNVKLAARGPDAIIPGLSEGLDVEEVLYTEPRSYCG
ncbi:hypothetical protein K503DRAFT_804044 [Rhizopogon vinicolor AM-OR11-026]|uniref:Svf1-like C-terminal domain-containing protein n=1 Tax=Rhizopogon vinicolor AM-OR11-026 TaxID=1314800 RepID=A0A1B7MMN4_9AGAM|nr:hypothetical protein K503DRAFT_804044 [Rhizopogon vinicolor AM-OR11-026]